VGVSDVSDKEPSANSRPLARKTFELPTFLGETVPVEFAARLREVRLEESALVMRCDTHHEPVLHDYYGTVCETTFQPPQPGRPLTVRLDALTDEIVRLRYAPGEGVSDVS